MGFLLLCDTHCHLNFEMFAGDRAEVLDRARQAGVLRILNPGVDLVSSREALSLSEAWEQVYAAVGVHPNDALTWGENSLDELHNLAKRPKTAAIGEIGLDYYRDRAPRDRQKAVFLLQLRLAEEHQLPVVIHTRNSSPADRQASADALSILEDWVRDLKSAGSPLAERPGVLHSFSDDLETALRATQIGFYIGITGPVTFRKAEQLVEVAAELPMEFLLLETDAPFMTPHPYRGKRNEPAYVQHISDKIAQVRGISSEEVARSTTMNASRLFCW